MDATGKLIEDIKMHMLNYLKIIEKSGVVFEVLKDKKIYSIFPDEIENYMSNPDKWIAERKY